MRKWATLLVIASMAAASGLAWWWATPTISLQCPGRRAPTRAIASAILGVGHGAMLGGFSLEGDALTVTTAARSQVTRPLEAGELELLERRLQSPRPLPVHLRSAEGIVQIEVECEGSTQRLEEQIAVGRQHPSFDSVLQTPTLSMAKEWIEGTLSDLDPRPKRLTAVAIEILRVAEPELLTNP